MSVVKAILMIRLSTVMNYDRGNTVSSGVFALE